MTLTLVMRIHSNDVAFMGKTLVRQVELPIAPIVGDVVFWDGGWGGLSVESRYISADDIELNVTACAESDVPAYVEAGWCLQGRAPSAPWKPRCA